MRARAAGEPVASGAMASEKWRITKQADRRRKLVTVTLSNEARAKLERLAARHSGGKSGVIEDLIAKEPEP